MRESPMCAIDDFVADPEDSADGGAHAHELGVIEDRLGQKRVGRDERRLQRVLRVVC